MSRCGALVMSGSLAAAAGLCDLDRGHQVPSVHTERMILFGGQSHPNFTRTLATRLGVKVSLGCQRCRLHIISVKRWAVCSKRPSAIRNTAFRSRKASMARTSTLCRLAGAGLRFRDKNICCQPFPFIDVNFKGWQRPDGGAHNDPHRQDKLCS